MLLAESMDAVLCRALTVAVNIYIPLSVVGVDVAITGIIFIFPRNEDHGEAAEAAGGHGRYQPGRERVL